MAELMVPTLEVRLECYEGPLSVLISLIKKNRVSIWDIPLSTITERFLMYVELVKEMNLRIAEDFIEMASFLIYIKSKMLLPSEDTDGQGEEDPRDRLIERIMEYEKIKAMVEGINSLPMLGRDYFVREVRSIDKEEDYDLLELSSIFFDLIKSREERYIVIREIKPTLEEKIKTLREILDNSGVYVWSMEEVDDHGEKVATILGMLELTKVRMATIYQRRPFGKIVLKRR
ncbi:MAG: segregation/condensation protein A [Syntrophorhabdaceae bacterium]|nr:segregation/condensation protein A [Syntrophorhabdaceae bacterium]